MTVFLIIVSLYGGIERFPMDSMEVCQTASPVVEYTGIAATLELAWCAAILRARQSEFIISLERQLAAETERCACIAQDNRQHSNQIVMRTLEAESAYEEACDDIAAAIREGAK